jgi:hypothetical protein
MTIVLILNILLSTIVVAAVVGSLAQSVVNQHRDQTGGAVRAAPGRAHTSSAGAALGRTAPAQT